MPARFTFQTIPLAEIPKKDSDPDLQPVVLVVDDEQVIADTLAAILSRSGYTAIAAYDGPTAVETAALIPPQMLITDVCMPGMSGIALAIAIREAVPDCKVLLFSGQISTAEMLAASSSAGYNFAAISKPIHPTELLAKISEFFAVPAEEKLATSSFLIGKFREARPA
ncbi:MAG TPA: response regulator [Silvibacterium sp.]|jgi:DNA-binding response OmpR family regulator|nr:response regulator [Silvibacterium sp.]